MEEFSFISKETFDKIIEEYLANSKTKGKEKLFIEKQMYEEIKEVLLGSDLRDSKFQSWCKSEFTLLKSGNDYVVCKYLNRKSKDVLMKEGKSTESLPVLVLEDMYRVICQEHVKSIHSGQKTLYNKLRSKWSGIKKKIVEEFVNNCEICVLRRSSFKSTLAAKPIVASKFLSRVQVIFNYLIY
jgi:hypothetical protein